MQPIQLTLPLCLLSVPAFVQTQGTEEPVPIAPAEAVQETAVSVAAEPTMGPAYYVDFDLRADILSKLDEWEGTEDLSDEIFFTLGDFKLLEDNMSDDAKAYLQSIEDYRLEQRMTRSELIRNPAGAPSGTDLEAKFILEMQELIPVLFGDSWGAGSAVAAPGMVTPWWQLIAEAIGLKPSPVLPLALYIKFLMDCQDKAAAWRKVKDARWKLYIQLMKYNCVALYDPACTFHVGGTEGCYVLECDCPPEAERNNLPRLKHEEVLRWKDSWGPVFKQTGQCIDKDMVGAGL